MKGILKFAGAVLILALVGPYLFGGGNEKTSAVSMNNIQKNAAVSLNNIQKQVATDSIRQYEIVSRNGNKIDRCVHAGIVAAAYVQARDESGYQLWKGRERADCADAGIRR